MPNTNTNENANANAKTNVNAIRNRITNAKQTLLKHRCKYKYGVVPSATAFASQLSQ